MNILAISASCRIKSKQYAEPLLIVSTCLLMLVSPHDSHAQCVAIPEWQFAFTNLTRCGSHGHLTNDTYYGAENVTWSSTSFLPNFGTATYSGYSDTEWIGETYNPGCDPGICTYVSLDDYVSIDIPFTNAPGVCLATAPCSGATGDSSLAPCACIWHQFFKSPNNDPYPPWSGSSMNSNPTGTVTIADGSIVTDTKEEYGSPMDLSSYVGTYTYHETSTYSQPNTLTSFASAALAAAHSAYWWDGYGPGGYYLITEYNRQCILAQIGRYHIRFKSKLGVRYTLTWDLVITDSAPVANT